MNADFSTAHPREKRLGLIGASVAVLVVDARQQASVKRRDFLLCGAFDERLADIVQGVVPFPRLLGPHVQRCISVDFQRDRFLEPVKNVKLSNGH
jgi:hypothetical protein